MTSNVLRCRSKSRNFWTIFFWAEPFLNGPFFKGLSWTIRYFRGIILAKGSPRRSEWHTLFRFLAEGQVHHSLGQGERKRDAALGKDAPASSFWPQAIFTRSVRAEQVAVFRTRRVGEWKIDKPKTVSPRRDPYPVSMAFSQTRVMEHRT